MIGSVCDQESSNSLKVQLIFNKLEIMWTIFLLFGSFIFKYILTWTWTKEILKKKQLNYLNESN